MAHGRSICALVVGCLLGAAHLESRAADAEAPADLQAKVFAKVLEYDKNLPQRAKDKVLSIGILVNTAEDASVKAGDAFQAFWDALTKAGGNVGGLSVKILRVDAEVKALPAWLAANKVAFLYIGPGLGSSLEALVTACRAAKVGTLAGDGAYVKQGLSLGIVIRGQKPQILVNLKAAREEGSSFRAELLQLADVVER